MVDSGNPYFDKFVACNLSVYLLGLALANPCFRTTSVGILFLLGESPMNGKLLFRMRTRGRVLQMWRRL